MESKESKNIVYSDLKEKVNISGNGENTLKIIEWELKRKREMQRYAMALIT